jgi:uncharacterized CHY-type Zn-finger protein
MFGFVFVNFSVSIHFLFALSSPIITYCVFFCFSCVHIFIFQTPCCNKIYTCRFCHDENESHCVNRKDVTELVCTNCDTRQKVQAECENCSLRFGKVSQILSEIYCLMIFGRSHVLLVRNGKNIGIQIFSLSFSNAQVHWVNFYIHLSNFRNRF